MSWFPRLARPLRDGVVAVLALALAWSFAALCVCAEAPSVAESHCAAPQDAGPVLQASCCCASTLQPARAVVVRLESTLAAAPDLAAPALPAPWAEIVSVPSAPVPVDHSPPPRLIALRV